jgi:hypothetical protein
MDLWTGRTTLRGEEAKQEMFLLSGEFHSGPISVVRIVGYFGLTFVIALFVVFAKMGYRIINSARGTPYEFCCLFFGIQAIIFPFFYIFIFGDGKLFFPYILLNVGVMKMLERSIKNLKLENARAKSIA